VSFVHDLDLLKLPHVISISIGVVITHSEVNWLLRVPSDAGSFVEHHSFL
jgi:hypothetical protein